MGATFQLAMHLFLQLAVILLATRLTGKVLGKIRQPLVVGEMVAGVLLGPSLFGLLYPAAQEFLFPKTQTVVIAGAPGQIPHPSMGILYAMSQVGLVLFMFLVGVDLDLRRLIQHSRVALAVSLSGILVPVVIGAAFGSYLGADGRLFGAAIQPWQAALFMASAMSITAFPVLARILFDAGHTRTQIGTLAIGAAAVNDAMAWILLACVIAATRGSFSIALLAAGGGLAYTAIMVFAARPALRSWERIAYGDDGVRPEALALVIALVMACAWITDAIGIYSVFGAFMAGIAMPRGRFADGVKRSLEPISTTLLVPIFFAYSGLNTRLDLLAGTSVLAIAAATIVVAFVCKGAGCALACRWAGATWRDSTALGILMNARGLMELVLANIALERGLITPSMFTILVLMAIVTTLAATPLYHWLRPSDWEAMPSAAEGKSNSVLEHGSQ